MFRCVFLKTVMSGILPYHNVIIKIFFTDDCDKSLCLGGQCKIENHKFICSCPIGFEFNNLVCEDINECLYNPCPLNAECINTVGSFKCKCVNGTIGDINGNMCKSPGNCLSDEDCTESGKCHNNYCVNPCNTISCGINADCVVIKHKAECECPPGSHGDPHKECIKLECLKDTDCESNAACVNSKCINPCNIPRACGRNADCLARSHIGYCSCLPGYTGDPLLGCIPIQYCTDDSRCSTGTKCVSNLCMGKFQ